jgi:tRNA dimethylallyltransferase
LAIDVAGILADQGRPAEVINADSMLVYRGMDIGTAKPTKAEMRGIPHHLIDVMDISQSASVAVFQTLGRQAINQCRDRGVTPIVVGGSALYLHAILDNFVFPPTDPGLRANLTTQQTQLGSQAMWRRLHDLDAQVANNIDPENSRRVIRALEAIKLTGQFQSRLPEWTYAIDGVIQLGVEIERWQMDARIAQREESMWDQGFVDEVRSLIDQGLRDSPTAARAIGYRQIIAYLDSEITEQQAKQLTMIKTRQFSRKQLSWWKRHPRISWLPFGCSTQGVLDQVRGVLP